MADNNSNNNGGGQGPRNPRVVGRKTVNVNRYANNTTEEKSSTSDLVEDLVKKTGTNSTNLQKILESVRASNRSLTSIETSSKDISTHTKQLIDKVDQLLTAISSGSFGGGNGGYGGGFGGGFGGFGGNGGGNGGGSGYQSSRYPNDDAIDRMGDLFDRSIAKLVNATNARPDSIWGTVSGGLGDTLTSFSNNITSAARDMLSAANVMGKATEKFRTAISLTRTGAEGDVDALMPQFLRKGDNVADTAALLQQNLINPIGIVGKDIEDMSKALRESRQGMIENGNTTATNYNYSTVNAAMLEMLAIERRRDVNASFGDAENRQFTSKQLEYLSVIGANTGKTVETILEASRKDNQDLSNMVATGILSKSQANGFMTVNEALRSNNMPQWAGVMQKLAAAGDDFAVFMAKNKDLAETLAKTGQTGRIKELAEIMRNNKLSDQERTNMVMSTIKAFGASGTGLGSTVGAMTLSPEAQGLFGEANLAQNYKNNAKTSDVAKTASWLSDFWNNTLGGPELKLVAAILANTAALTVNTIALGGKGLASLIGGGGKGIGKAIGKLGKFLGAGALGVGALGVSGAKGAGKLIAKGARGVGSLIGKSGAKTVADAAEAVSGTAAKEGEKAVADIAAKDGAKVIAKEAAKTASKSVLKSLLKKIPLLGLFVGGYFAAGRYMGGDTAGAAMELASGAASTIPGVGTAASVGIDATLAARDMGAFDPHADDDDYVPMTPYEVKHGRKRATAATVSTPNSISATAAETKEHPTDLLAKIAGYLEQILKAQTTSNNHLSNISGNTQSSGTATSTEAPLSRYERKHGRKTSWLEDGFDVESSG